MANKKAGRPKKNRTEEIIQLEAMEMSKLDLLFNDDEIEEPKQPEELRIGKWLARDILWQTANHSPIPKGYETYWIDKPSTRICDEYFNYENVGIRKKKYQ